jgi:hypothetical protein
MFGANSCCPHIVVHSNNLMGIWSSFIAQYRCTNVYVNEYLNFCPSSLINSDKLVKKHDPSIDVHHEPYSFVSSTRTKICVSNANARWIFPS